MRLFIWLTLMQYLVGTRHFIEEGNGHPLQYSCLGNLMARGVWWVQSTGLQRVRHN